MTRLILASAAALVFIAAPTTAQVAGAPAATLSQPASITAATDTATAMKPRFVSNAVIQPSGAADVPATGDLPICKPDQQDNCINGWEKNRSGNRPLEYWPGKPASEIDEPLPATQPDQ